MGDDDGGKIRGGISSVFVATRFLFLVFPYFSYLCRALD